jgi:hypothetical protein
MGDWGAASRAAVCSNVNVDLRLQIEGVRCFSTKQDAVVRPLTLLVGENSSGKSTFLALCQIASSIIEGFVKDVSFNEPPFLLGAYDQIATYRGGRGGRAKSFSIVVSVNDGTKDCGSIEATFVPELGQPFLRSWCLSAGSLKLEIKPTESQLVTLIGRSPRGMEEVQSVKHGGTQFVHLPGQYYLLRYKSAGLKNIFSGDDWTVLANTWGALHAAFGQSPYAFAPIRTNPQRTYDPVSPEARPEGSHVPMLLAKLSNAEARNGWSALESGLNEFGSKSGLYDQIEVIRKGKKDSDPFQIGVKSGGPSFNLVDVGYGVSQVLPILVDTLRHTGDNMLFLLQQPEVHLHPRAQAELGSFFASQANRKRRFIVETHSDYLVDRVRMEVRRGKLVKPEDVSLLYFERHKQGAVIHNIELDKEGAITNPPATYRRFFLDEELSLLNI